MNGWAWKSRHLLLTAPVISKQGSTVKASLDIARDVYNPLLWSVSLQNENGMHTITVHQTEGAARKKIGRMKGITPMISMKQGRD
jgi:hypothetical protein